MTIMWMYFVPDITAGTIRYILEDYLGESISASAEQTRALNTKVTNANYQPTAFKLERVT